MRSLATDFDLIVLWPLIAVALILLWQSARMYLSAAKALRNIEKHLGNEVRSGAVSVDSLDTANEYRRTKVMSRRLLQGSIAALFILFSVKFTGDIWKLHIAFLVWTALLLISAGSFLGAIGLAWYGAKKFNWWLLGLCLLGILLSAASAEHCFHQQINARHATCPRCGDNDFPDDDR